MSSSVDSNERTSGSSTDDTKYSEEEERNESVWSTISEGHGILKTTTIEITEETAESVESSARSSAVPMEWEEVLQVEAGDEPSVMLSLVVEQGRLAKTRRRVD